MQAVKNPLQQTQFQARAAASSRLAMWLDVALAALVFYIFT